MLKALSHPIRLQIVKLLINGELCVCDINDIIDARQSNLSQHLKILKDAGILKQHKEGSRVIYGLSQPEIRDLISMTEAVVKKNILSLKF
jgi:ArsR family transcriptional regulator